MPPSIAEPVSHLRKVPIVESHEPLVDFLDYCPKLVFDRPRFRYERARVVRESVAAALKVATESLESGYKLAILEGWRAPHIQLRMYRAVWQEFASLNPHWSDAQLKRVVNRYSAPLDPRVPPPHTTGGAVDITLLRDDGTPCDLCSPYVWRDPKSFLFGAAGLSEEARRNRQIIGEALGAGGLTNYPSEYWHWSYGDQGWAYRGGHSAAIFAGVTPEGWFAEPSEISEEPLEFIGE